MQMTKLKLVTIIAEAFLEERLLRELRQLGAKGYTIGEARGEGTRGIHASSWEGPNLRIETLVGPEMAEQIMRYVAEHYFADYAVIMYSVDAEVLRGEKYL